MYDRGSLFNRLANTRRSMIKLESSAKRQKLGTFAFVEKHPETRQVVRDINELVPDHLDELEKLTVIRDSLEVVEYGQLAVEVMLTELEPEMVSISLEYQGDPEALRVTSAILAVSREVGAKTMLLQARYNNTYGPLS
jgi:hypothetical protein